MKWQLQETRALQVEFSSILPTDGYRLSLFGRGPIALHGLVHFLNTIGPSLTKVIYAYFDRISCMFIVLLDCCKCVVMLLSFFTHSRSLRQLPEEFVASAFGDQACHLNRHLQTCSVYLQAFLEHTVLQTTGRLRMYRESSRRRCFVTLSAHSSGHCCSITIFI